jgi:hypothetical protein
MEIKELFAIWVEPDIAAYYLGCLLGIMEYDTEFDNYRKFKGILNSKNPVCDMLFEMLDKMVAIGTAIQ